MKSSAIRVKVRNDAANRSARSPRGWAKDADKDFVVKTVLKAARTGDKGAFGDGKIFISSVDEVYTISSGIKESGAGELEEVAV